MSDVFTNKEEIDTWYDSVIDGLSRGLATDVKSKIDEGFQGNIGHEYVILIGVLNRLKKGFYLAIGEKNDPEVASFKDLGKNLKKY